jgi:acyl-CoA reductase-like NAD-dependent aldehyde dehydrogenase
MATIQKTITPIDGSVYVERPLATPSELDAALKKARTAFAEWKRTPVEQRCALLSKAVDAFVARRDDIAKEITHQIGRPLGQSPGEVRGFEERARYMLSIAPQALGDIGVGEKAAFNRFIRREPLGVVFVVAPWNYPYLTAVNAVIPALAAGNVVLLKHSAQTPLCAERFAEAFRTAGLADGVFQQLHLSHDDTTALIKNPAVDFVAFTGSVPGGHAVQQAAAERFIGTGMELGGCDPAYVRHDANLPHAIENLVDGAYFNSGQSCCGIQRVYVHADVYDRFRDGFVALTEQYKLGNPLESGVNLGPVVRAKAAEQIRGQVAAGLHAGGRALIDEKKFTAAKTGTAYVAPQAVEVTDNRNPLMQEECFGPVAALMKVRSDEEAVRLMNDNPFGLTAAIWTEDEPAAIRLGDAVETGTWFMNRCDYLDPALAWVGVKDSGRGCTLSRLGYEHLTRPKSFHLRTQT